MIHAAPQVDFMGVILSQSLEVGRIKINRQLLPAVRFYLLQNGGRYPLTASGTVAAEIYAYCLAAVEQGQAEIHVKAAGILLVDIKGNASVSATSVAWYTSVEMREQAAASLLKIFEAQGTSAPRFKNATGPLLEIET